MENIKLNLSMQDVSRLLQIIVRQPYDQVADLVEKIKSSVEFAAAEHRSMGAGVQAGAGVEIRPVVASPQPNGEAT